MELEVFAIVGIEYVVFAGHLRSHRLNLESAFKSAKSSVAPTILMVEETAASIDEHPTFSPRKKSFLCRSLLRGGQTLASVDLLATHYRYQDMWVLCRIICELMINSSYLQVAPESEFQRWSNYDIWTDERLVSNLASSVPEFEAELNQRELEWQREQRCTLEKSQLYKGCGNSWSKKTLEQRAKVVDDVLKLERDTFQLLCRLTVKIGNGFVHVSPKGIGPQRTPIVSPREPSPADIQAATQALSMSATAVYAGLSFTRAHAGLSEHLLANRFGDALRVAFGDSI